MGANAPSRQPHELSVAPRHPPKQLASMAAMQGITANRNIRSKLSTMEQGAVHPEHRGVRSRHVHAGTGGCVAVAALVPQYRPISHQIALKQQLT